MKSYEKHLEELSYEIADDIVKNEIHPKWEITLDQTSVAKSLCTIYDKGFKKVSEDLEISVRKNIHRIKNKREKDN